MRFLHFLFFITLALFTGCLTDTDTTPLPNNNLTPDTTSHDFMWQIDTIGIRNSILYDVAVIDENNIWAVGQIETEETGIPDSNGNIIPKYNAVHWNGSDWELIRIPAVTYAGTLSRGPINAIYAFSSDNIWIFSDAGSYAHWDGQNWYSEYVFERIGSILKIWAKTPDDIYFVGTNGNITHYNGNRFTRIYSGTTLDINDIWGSKNEKTGAWEILCVASNQFTSDGRQILRIRDSYVEPVNSDSLPNSLSGIWFMPGEKYYVVGDGAFMVAKIGQSWTMLPHLSPFYELAIEGTAANDIFITGSFGLMAHFNGSTWRTYQGSELPVLDGHYGSICASANFIVTVGRIVGSAVILRGWRN